MKKMMVCGLGFLALLLVTSPVVRAHCEVPCGIYGDEMRFLCRAPRAAFRTREEFVAAAVKRYLGVLSDQRLAETLPFLREVREAGRNLIVESNRLLDHLSPDLFLVVLDYSVPDF